MALLTPENLRKLVSKGKQKLAIEGLMKLAETSADEDFRKSVAGLSARFTTLEKEKIDGTIRDTEIEVREARLISSLLSLIDEADTTPQPQPYSTARPFTTILSKSIPILAGAFLLFWAGWKYLGPGFTARDSLDLTIFVKASDGKLDSLLKYEGQLILDLGGDRRSALIGENGRTHFGEIPLKFDNQEVPIELLATGYVLADPDRKYLLDGSPVYLEVRSNCQSCMIIGNVRTLEAFLEGAVVGLPGFGIFDTTDVNGYFELSVPPEKEKKEYSVSVTWEGKIVAEADITPDPLTPSVILVE